MYYVYKNNEVLQLDDVKEFRDKMSNYGLFIDLETMNFHEHQKGGLNLIRKRVLGKLLCYLIIKSPKKFTANELYSAVWGVSALPLSQEVSVKTAISRLRKIIEPVGTLTYILKTEPDFLGRRGAYYFNVNCNYCLIRPNTVSMF
ncbi:MAG: winged helix-turn-helix domain-containing protein [Candidatus Cloacimonetes bacterium]|nr:winged helix-turn-helix domain-containing protein [Candidatus Cloacimonadota bacterium]